MRNKNEGLKKHTTNINEVARERLGITRDDYALCQYVHYRLADTRGKKSGWCSDTKAEIAAFIGITRPGLYKMLDRMERLNLLEIEAATGFCRVTGKWIDTEQNRKQSLQEGVNKVDTKCKQSLQSSVNKVTLNIEEKDIEKEEREGERESTPARAENFDNLEEEKNKGGKVAPPPAEAAAPGCPSCAAGVTHKVGEGCDRLEIMSPTHLLKTTGPDSNGVTEVEGIALPVATTAITYDQYPLPKTGLELQEKMRAYFMMYPNEWEVSVLQTAKATNWQEGKTEDCMLRFCLHKEKTGDLKKTYHQYRADLTLWFMNQKQFDRPAPGASGASQSPTSVTVSTPQTQTRY